jgi:CheY-like chemotaxis protein
MDKETQAHIFEPFFTTKELGKGTGLGLSMVYGIIKQSGGYIWVYSEPGQGTTFKIYLPVVEEPAQKPEPRRVSGELPGGTETVLLVEDEDRVREFVHQLLASIGYTVFPARDGDEAIAMCERNTGPIQLLLTDIVMPRISGPALAERLEALYPNMKVIYMSGYTEEAILQRALLDHNAAFLQKPCSPAELAQRVREVLDAPHQFRR